MQNNNMILYFVLPSFCWFEAYKRGLQYNNPYYFLQEKRRLLNQVDSLELALQIKADEVKEVKAKLDAEIKGRLEDRDQHEQVSKLISCG